MLSRLSSTNVGEVELDGKFYRQVFAFGVMPVASLFATQFPDLGSSLLEWLKPIESLLP